MRHTIDFGGRSFRTESEMPYTHVLMGQRSESEQRPKIDSTKLATGDITPEQRAAHQIHSFNIVQGLFAFKPLAWAESVADAEALRSRFPSPEWENLTILPVSETVIHG